MQRIPLITGSRVARSPLANAQQCVNYYPERNAPDAPVPLTHYQRPGLRPVAVPPVPGPSRGIWRASNGQAYTVIGQTCYAIQPNWQLTPMGRLGAVRSTLCSLTDNGIEALLVDGSQQGYTWALDSNNFQPFVDATGLFQGADRVDVIDGFVLWNMPGTHQFGSTLNFTLAIDPTYTAGKVNYPDPLQSLLVQHHEIYLLGQVTSETWYDAGNPAFPFAELPGADHDHGTVAKYSLAGADTSVFWLGQNRQGQGVVMRAHAYDALRVSNHEVEYAIRLVANTVGLADATGYCYQQDGHLFYVLTLPAGDQTWVFDDSAGEWHRRGWTDRNGVLHRERASCFALVNGTNVVGDWENGTIYALDPLCYTDTVAGVNYPIRFLRSFPHVGAGEINLGGPGITRPVRWDGQRMKYNKFVLDLQCGNAPVDADGLPAQLALRWSTDRGVTFGSTVLQTAGRPGQFETQPLWQSIGIARDVVFEISHQIAGEAALNGAWVDAEVLGS